MSLPNNGNGFGANQASLRAFRQVNTSNSASDFHESSSHNGVNLLQTLAFDIPAGTTVAGLIANIPANFIVLAISASGVNTLGAALTLTLTGGIAGSVVLAAGGVMNDATLPAGAPVIAASTQVTVTPSALTGSQPLTLNISGIQA